MKKECVAMLLAGGQGSRLYVLTGDMAKPAVPFGGKFRIIDFPLSNCTNSGIDTVGVLTQYRPLELNSYIGSGQPWELDRLNGGVHILPPYQSASGASWYKGTANAIYQNIGFVDLYDPEYVAVLSGDHIYKMDYSRMLQHHKDAGAACTISVMEVPWSEASRFGIMSVDEHDRITAFAEKPKEPKSNLASMGIYIFTWQKLRSYLLADEADPTSDNDFGKNIIPAMLDAGEVMSAYRFEGYWKDVGTLDSLWDANMDMLSPGSGLNLLDKKWPIYCRTPSCPPAFLGPHADVGNSAVAKGCGILGEVKNSVLSYNTQVGQGASVSYSVVMPGAVIEEGAVVQYAIIGERCRVGRGAQVGAPPETAQDPAEWGIAVLGPDTVIAPGEVVPAKALLDRHHGLRELIEHRIHGSIPFGGNYRVVDFMLSNMVGAGVRDVGVIMHGKCQSMLDHLGTGKSWDLSRNHGGLTLLPAFAYAERRGDAGRFRGKVEALGCVMDYLKDIRQDYVVLTDSDLVINLPLDDVLRDHIDSGADLTAVCTSLPGLESDTYFQLDNSGRIVDVAHDVFTPEGFRCLNIFVLRRDLLIQLVTDCMAHNQYSFRHNILQDRKDALHFRAYVWDGYAARIDTIESYYRRSMELLRPEIRMELFTPQRPILAKENDSPSSYMDGSCVNSLVADGCDIQGTVKNCVLFRGVRIEPGADVEGCILFKGTVVRRNAVLRGVITDKYVTVQEGRTLMGHENYPLVIARDVTV